MHIASMRASTGLELAAVSGGDLWTAMGAAPNLGSVHVGARG
ncbi:MAG: hypothetical protein AAGK69_12830 [Pseudomonadota bacterium]